MITKKFLLILPKCEISKPIIHNLVKNYDLIVNIFRAKITPEKEGFLALDVDGDQENISNAVSYLVEQNIKVNENYKGMQWDTEKCSACGACVPHCPTNALHVANMKTQEVDFNSSSCIGCLNCIHICPYDACSSMF